MSSRSQVCGLKIQVSIPVEKKAKQLTQKKTEEKRHGNAHRLFMLLSHIRYKQLKSNFSKRHTFMTNLVKS